MNVITEAWKSNTITYSECVSVPFGIRHAMRMRPIIVLSSVISPALPYSSTLSHKTQDLKKLLNIKCVLIFSTTFV